MSQNLEGYFLMGVGGGGEKPCYFGWEEVFLSLTIFSHFEKGKSSEAKLSFMLFSLVLLGDIEPLCVSSEIKAFRQEVSSAYRGKKFDILSSIGLDTCKSLGQLPR